jgi:hypothetical protein
MAKKSPSKRSLLQNYLDEANPGRIGEAELLEIRRRLAPISDSYLRQLLRESNRPLAPLIEGVRQESFDQLAASLIALSDFYAGAMAKGEAASAAECRRLVIEAKDRVRWAAHSPKATPEKKTEKEEMVEWMLVWLENPRIFPTWARLRQRQPSGLMTDD